MRRFAAVLVIAAAGLSAGPAWAQMDWLTPHLDAQRANNLLQHQQRMITPSQDSTAGQSTTAAGPQVIDQGFTVYVLGPDGTETVQPGTTVPHLPRQGCWRWGVRLEGYSGAVDFIETLTLPAPAGIWEGPSTAIYSDDGRSAINRVSIEPEDGWIGNAWCVAEGDPVGKHSIVVEIDDVVVAEFKFTVE